MNPVSLNWCRLKKLTRVSTAIAYAKSVGVSRESCPLYVDIGARGGLPKHWTLVERARLIEPVFFEPDPEEAPRIKQRFPRSNVLPYALGSSECEETLNITKEPGRSSILMPDHEFLAQYGNQPWAIERKVKIQINRMDRVWPLHFKRSPSFVKVDVQGYELEVLRGMGAMLSEVQCIEHESVYRPLYLKQPVFGQIYSFLSDQGFDLVKTSPLGLYKGAVLEFNAYWVRRDTHDSALTKFWKMINNVADHDRIVAYGY